MKEFTAQTGGRFVFADDLINLQELSLAFGEIFSECDNFIISGCKVSGTTISSGYVYLNKKIRYCNGKTGITSWPQYIYEQNSIEQLNYNSGGYKEGRKIYGTVIGNTVPNTNDEVTLAPPVAITIPQVGGLTLKEAFIGKHALLLNSDGVMQTIQGAVTFNEDVIYNKLIKLQKDAQYFSTIAFTNDYSFEASAIVGNSNYKLNISNSDGCKVFHGVREVMSLSSSMVSVSAPLSASNGKIGSIALNDGHIYYPGSSNNSGKLQINMKSYLGNTNYLRTTEIGDGKGNVVFKIPGSGNIDSNRNIRINAHSDDSVLSLKAYKANSDVSMRNYISLLDNSNNSIAELGFVNNNNTFDVNNKVTNGVVNILPAIKENGVLLSEKYALKDDLTTLSTNISDTYATKAQHNLLNETVSSFTTNVQTYYATKDELNTLRNDLTAPDTGWHMLSENLFIRRIDKAVYIQGYYNISYGDGSGWSNGERHLILPSGIPAPYNECGIYIPMRNARMSYAPAYQVMTLWGVDVIVKKFPTGNAFLYFKLDNPYDDTSFDQTVPINFSYIIE